jgi:hypothetical protein
MTSYLQNRWVDGLVLLSSLAVLAGVVGAVWRLLNPVISARIPKKSELLLHLQHELKTNPSMLRASDLFAGRVPHASIEVLLRTLGDPPSAAELSLRKDLDHLFGLLQKVAFAVTVSKLLTQGEAECFSWYFREIQKHPILSDYFYSSGFLDLWDFAQSWAEKIEMDP